MGQGSGRKVKINPDSNYSREITETPESAYNIIKAEKEPKIVVHVEDGLIQAMYSNVPGIDVKVFDLDVLDDEEEADKREKELEKAKEGLTEVYWGKPSL